ncbi:hypothetical protein [Solirubrobacter soli]|uniref:hypothetical protein n=1 Tax=Solirubrobacter soli TaxID=363832 RepID=UPI0003FF1C32|nr:hypothetical protein [Solirubrobacter soli]
MAAKVPFPGYDTMDVKEVRKAMAQHFHEALDGFRAIVKDAIAFEKETGTHGGELDGELKAGLIRLESEIQEGTDRWGGVGND